MKKLMAFVAALLLSAMGTAHAHLVTIGWLDNGDGTVTLFGEHWHGNQTVPSTANGGLGIYDGGGNLLYKTQWAGVFNNVDKTDAGFGKTGAGTTALTGSDAGTGNSGSGTYDDWLYTAPLVIGNGTWGFFTGSNCCIDTMHNIIYATLTGITSVPDGQGPGGVPGVPVPAAALLFVPAMIGLMGMRRRARA